ncbi:Pentatricopeptide repeat-containing protein [Hibiscus syriacus]|uniref:Pentatricopeptide repeat-containing protein n=1 Tax=Hibiscus syriacus TaxID=106335 RepID=A0A6A3CU91_HIBSY|nr:Pentatricopeptide repeat-containing protein [Hibiscus syriacus]
MELFEEMSEVDVELNVMGCTSLIQCLGKAKRIDELVKEFTVSIEQGIKPDDRLCGCLLSVVSLCDNREDMERVVACLRQANHRKNHHERAHDLLYLGTLYGFYPRLHNKTTDEWSLNVRTLSVGAALTALEEWVGTLAKIIKRGEALPELFSAQTGSGTHKFAQGLSNSFASHLKQLGAPFKQSEDRAGCFVATREVLVLWLQSKIPSSAVTS